LSGVFKRLGNGFGLRHQFAVGVVGVGVLNLLALIGNGDGVAGAVEVVDVELVGCGVDHRRQAFAVNVVFGDGIGGVGFGQEVACGVVNVFCYLAVSCRFDAVADAVVDVAAGALADEPVSNVVGIVAAALGFQLAFVVVAERGAVLAG